MNYAAWFQNAVETTCTVLYKFYCNQFSPSLSYTAAPLNPPQVARVTSDLILRAPRDGTEVCHQNVPCVKGKLRACLAAIVITLVQTGQKPLPVTPGTSKLQSR